MENTSKFSENLRKALEDRGISQAKLAKMINYTRGYVNQLVNGKYAPTRENILRICDALSISPQTLDPLFSSRIMHPSSNSTSKIPKMYIYLLEHAYMGLRDARSALLESDPARLRSGARGKEDTGTFDAQCEMIIVQKLKEYSPLCAILTEEREIRGIEYINEVCWVVDPVDRSDYFKDLLAETIGAYDSVGAFIADSTRQELWTKEPLHNPTGSVTCLIKGKVLFSIIIDYLLGTVFLAFESKAKYGNVDNFDSPISLLENGQDLIFEKRERFGKNNSEGICYLGKQIYADLFHALGFHEENKPQNSDYHTPGGPARVLFLTDLSTYKPKFILSNGEKISEFISWISFAIASKDLVVYELTPLGDTNFVRYGVIMAPPVFYTALQTIPSASSGLPAEIIIDTSRLTNLDIPCNFRSAILITHVNNDLFNADLRVRKSVRELYPNRITK